MNVSFAFVEQGIGRAGGSFFRPGEMRSRRAVVPCPELAQAACKIVGSLRSAGNRPNQKKKGTEHPHPRLGNASLPSLISARIRSVHRFAESDSHECPSMFAQSRLATAPEFAAPHCPSRGQNARACRLLKGNYWSSSLSQIVWCSRSLPSLPRQFHLDCSDVPRVSAKSNDSPWVSRCEARRPVPHSCSQLRPGARHCPNPRSPDRAPPTPSERPPQTPQIRRQSPCPYSAPATWVRGTANSGASAPLYPDRAPAQSTGPSTRHCRSPRTESPPQTHSASSYRLPKPSSSTPITPHPP